MSDVHVEVRTPNNTQQFSQSWTNCMTCPNSLVKESLFEFFGTFTFITLSLGNVAIAILYPESGLNWTGVSISWGLNLMFGILTASFQSPGHLNPAVSAAMYIYNQSITFKQLIYYSISQLFGAMFGALYVYSAYYNKLKDLPDLEASSIFVTYKNPNISYWTAFNIEMVGTALLVSGIFMLLDNIEKKEQLPLYVGAWLTTLVFSFGFQTAFAWNPARDLGPRIITAIVGYDSFNYIDQYFWIPIVAPYTGAIIAVIFYKYLFKPNIY